MKSVFRTIMAGALGACLLLVGCGGEPYTYQSSRELQTGPGLLSGDDGVFTLFGLTPEEREAVRRQEAERQEQDIPSPTAYPEPEPDAR